MDRKVVPIAVVMLIFNPDRKSLLRTLKTIVMQEGIDFQLVITDDGSTQDYFNEIKNFCNIHNFTNVKFIKSEVNVGTVKNFLNGVIAAEGKYIRGISPGDFLYDKHTLRDIYEYMSKNNADVCFGNIVYYNNQEDRIKTFQYRQPFNRSLYTLKDYNQVKVKKKYYLLHDWICGACASYSRTASIKYLSQIQNKIIFAEDFIINMMIFDEIQVYYLNKYVLWYEYGTGVSTNKNTNWLKRLIKDHYSFYDVMFDKYGDIPLIRKAYRLLQVDNINNKVIRWIIKTLICPSLLIHNIKLKIYNNKQAEKDFDLDILREILLFLD